MYIEEYLLNLSRHITEKPLPVFKRKQEYTSWREREVENFKKMLGIDILFNNRQTDDVKKVITGKIENKDYTIKNLYFESVSYLFVTGNLYIPKNKFKTHPAILYLCGHAQEQKHHYQNHAISLVKAGFVVLIIDTIQLGEVKGVHQGTYSLGYYYWISKGYTPAGIETWNAIRAIDLLTHLPQVDYTRIGVTGNSGGGATVWWVSCVDERVKTTVSSCGTGTIHSHIKDKTINGHCDCMFPNNSYSRSFISMYALVAPNPVLIVTPEYDKHFNYRSVKYVYDKLKKFYRHLNASDNIGFFSFQGPHGYSDESRRRITQFFISHLQNKFISMEKIYDFDGEQESLEKLKVYHDKIPANDESTSVNEWFIADPERPEIFTYNDFEIVKARILTSIKKESFSIFNHLESTKKQTEGITVKQQSLDNRLGIIKKFFYKTEGEYTLTGMMQTSDLAIENQHKIAVNLRSPNTVKEDFTLIENLDTDWMKVCLNIRGTDVTSWSKTLEWYIRRSLAICGTSITALRIWDTLQGLKALRSSFKDNKKIVLSGKGEMAVVAVLSALIDGRISAVILEEPPKSFINHNESISLPIEIINILRYADISTLTALLWPTLIIFYNKSPESFRYTEEVYKKLGYPGGIWRLYNLKDLNQIAFG